MAKLNQRGMRTMAQSVLSNTDTPVRGHQGGTSFGYDKKTELFLLGVSMFAGEETFYESAKDRDARWVRLIREVTKIDPEWTAKYLVWLRGEGNIRTASIMGAVEYGRAVSEMINSGSTAVAGLAPFAPSARSVVASVMQRPDEPGEVLAYWLANYGRTLPRWMKTGLGDGVKKLYSEFSTLKYDTSKSSVRFGDVVNLAMFKTEKGSPEAALMTYLMARRRGKALREQEAAFLPMIHRAEAFNKMDKVAARRILLSELGMMKSAGMTWEQLSGFGKMDKEAWEAVIPQMGYMALLRNLRNFSEAGISRTSIRYVEDFLTNPEKVAKSRQLPFRFYSAYAQVSAGDQWNAVLNEALDLATQNVPKLTGKSLVLVDTSASMTQENYSSKSKAIPLDSAAVFAAALAKNSDVRLVQFASSAADLPVPRGASVLKTVQAFRDNVGRVGHGTDVVAALRAYKDEDRVFLFSDLQGATRVRESDYPSRNGKFIPVYSFNLGGYAASSTQSDDKKGRYLLGGLSDKVFSMVPMLETRNGSWPWEQKAPRGWDKV